MSNNYCVIGKLPKGQRMGTMKECIEKGQVRQYGLKKVDPKLLENAKAKPAKSNERGKLMEKYGILSGKIKRLKGKIADADDKKDIQKMKKEVTKLTKDLDDVKAQLNPNQKK